MENHDENLIRYKKWRRLYIAVLICSGVLILISNMLQIVNGFVVDLRGLAFTVCALLSLALEIIFLILIVICYVKIRKLKKFLVKSEGDCNNVAVKEEQDSCEFE